MTEEEKHIQLRKIPFDIELVKPIFDNHEIDILKKYGTWMEGLYLKKIAPLTKDQEEFISSLEFNTPPTKEYSKIFWKYIKRKELLETQNLDNQKKLIKDDREDWKKIRRSRY